MFDLFIESLHAFKRNTYPCCFTYTDILREHICKFYQEDVFHHLVAWLFIFMLLC
uniref:Uncharacterized protein n=1 Tax=Arundo donax TaxID=35708 RepID=A0A0A9C9H3_ARUDO